MCLGLLVIEFSMKNGLAAGGSAGVEFIFSFFSSVNSNSEFSKNS